ncbi:hypothetical protein T265_02879 [Opisthorchis viverrini]|uniref:Uncharacterized protein n=2 Tax=Opisthorchis viverrini TaxID=6198 RepID=A0A074ZTG6_OPIVI|nr:hypothetical protein T265_02879 [Opisthorchis viverrini]KER30728.1 hypothetical protein T265_02879 [Opisthorchis viverrini]
MGYCIAYAPSFFIPLVFAAIMGLPMTVRLTGLSTHCTRSNLEETSTWGCTDKSKCKSDTLIFDGSSWTTFIMQTNQTNDRLSVQFRTREADQLLLYTVIKNLPDADDPTRIQVFMAVYLLNGSLTVAVERYVQNDIPSFQTMSINRQMDCISNYGTCADKQWHQFTQTLAKNTCDRNEKYLWLILRFTGTNEEKIKTIIFDCNFGVLRDRYFVPSHTTRLNGRVPVLA